MKLSNIKSFVSKSSVGVFLRGKGTRVSSELMPQLEGTVKEILEAAVKRAEKNGRSTVMAQDL